MFDANSSTVGIAYVAGSPSSSTGTWVNETASYTVPTWAACPCYAYIYAALNTGSQSDVARFDAATVNVSGSGASDALYYLTDHLGTSRVITNSAGSLCYDADFYPFGGERAITNSCPQNYKFTGKERDSESGLDNFDFRYDASTIGRYTSPDSLGGRLSNPQSLNRYAYVLNNPLTLVDPFGLEDQEQDRCNSPTSFCAGTGPDVPNGQAGTALTLSMPSTTGAPQTLETGSISDFVNSSNSGTGSAPAASGPGSSSADAFQFGLGLAGAIPGPIGTGANLINAGLSIYRGQYGQAALSVAFAIPFVGTIGRTAQFAEDALEAAKGVEGIYEFVGSSGRIYVGQSGNIGLRLAQHLQSGALLEEGISSIRFTEVSGGKFVREIAEQLRINELGGIGNLQNVRNAIGAAREYLMVPFK